MSLRRMSDYTTTEFGGEMKEAILFDHAPRAQHHPSAPNNSAPLQESLFRVQSKNALCRAGLEISKREKEDKGGEETVTEKSATDLGRELLRARGERRCGESEGAPM
jgi:hypothetical protein